MTYRRRLPAIASLILSISLVLGGCATVDAPGSIETVNRDLNAFTRNDLRLARSTGGSPEQRAGVDALLAAPLSQDAAIRLALLGSPALQALLADRMAEIAEAAQSGRPSNPVFTYERLRTGGETEISRMLGIGLLELLTLPQRRRAAAAATEAARVQLAATVVEEVTRVRQAWVRAVAAEQRLRYADQVLESAAASAELARRMEAAGNFNRIARARQQAFEADARTEAVLARQQATATREELVRALGLAYAEASRLQLPERLPDVPKELASAAEITKRVNAERLDVRLARAQFDAAASRRGLGAVTSWTDLELGIQREGETRGVEVEVRLPVFDLGELERSALDARTLAAAQSLEATQRAAGSHLRESYAAYLAAHRVARHHLDELVPLRRTIAEESLLRYNGMIIGVFELLEDAREQVKTVMDAIEAEEEFWLAEAALESALVGRPVTE